MSLPVARPVASSASTRITCIYRPKPPNLPLTNSGKVSDK
jgi:hypothetical protein